MPLRSVSCSSAPPPKQVCPRQAEDVLGLDRVVNATQPPSTAARDAFRRAARGKARADSGTKFGSATLAESCVLCALFELIVEGLDRIARALLVGVLG